MQKISLIITGLVLALAMGCATVGESSLIMSDSHRDLGDSHLRAGDNERAIGEYKRALNYNSKDANTHFGIAEAFKRKGHYEDAVRHFELAIKSDPDHQSAKLNLGVVYILDERWGDAIELFKRLAEDPSFIRPSRALVNLGWAQYNSGDFKSAKHSFQRALISDPNNHVAHLDLGILYYEEGSLVEAISEFSQAAEILQARTVKKGFGPVEAEVRFRAAQAQIKLGKRKQALKQLEMASKLGGKGEWGRKSREYLDVLR
ncbi:MAG: tetratricopeptide repeat protein [bacterium]|nr:tetratricopeptide repeat protein [bacterium]